MAIKRGILTALFFALAASAFGGTPQSITFPAVASRITTGGPITLNATASSGLPVDYSLVSSGNVATLNGSTLSLTGHPCSVTVKATQPGDSTCDPAAQVYRSFAVGDAALRFVKIASGHSTNHAMTIRAGGSLWAWGENSAGQLGDGSFEGRLSPVQIGSDTNWASVACGSHHTAALRSDGTLWAWGDNFHGQLGNGSDWMTRQTIPAKVGSETNWASVACGHGHTVALRTDGSLWACGFNGFGQLGNGSKIDRRIPVQIGSDLNWASIACGYSHTLALRTDGTLWAWGSNFYGQLGDGSATQRSSPVQIGSDTNWASVACGQLHTVAVRTDGTLWAWGDNVYGELGDASAISRTRPAQIGTGTGWASMPNSLGRSRSAALAFDGSLWTFGNSTSGQLGRVDIFSSTNRVWPERGMQTLTFGALPDLTVGQEVALDATTGSGLPITYAVFGPATLAGTTLTATGAGQVTVLAYQAGDSAWLSTEPVRRTLNVTIAPHPEIALSGNGTDIVHGDTTPGTADHTDFGSVLVAGGTVVRTFAITNSGTATLTLAGTAPGYVALSDSGAFSVTTQPSSDAMAANGGTVTFVITYAPESLGTHTATVGIASDDPDENPFTFVVKGTGRDTPNAQETWRQTWFGTPANSGDAADTADPDHDGLDNLVEWTCHLDPTTGSGSPGRVILNGANLEFTYTRRVSAVNAGAVFTVEWSETLLTASWSSSGVNEQILSDDGTVQVVRTTFPANGGRLLARLTVTAPP